jgi:3-oxoacyl-[acyl-carrier-protein] synthase II
MVTPLGEDPAGVFERLCRGESATTRDAPFDTTGFASSVVGPLPDDTDLLAGMRKDQSRYVRKNAKVMSRDTRLAMATGGRAVADAGLPLGEVKADPVLPTLDHTRLGVVYGVGYMPPELDDFAATIQASLDEQGRMSLARWGADGIPLMQPLWLLKFLPNMPACHMGVVWDCQGPSNSLPCNEASGLLAVGEAFRHVARNTADVMFTGGTESKINPSAIMRQCLLSNASAGFEATPEAAHRPFDAGRTGSVCSEGAATLLLESAEHAATRGAAVKARIAGFASACATTLPNVPETSGAAIARAMRAALRDAGCQAGDIDVVVAHGVAVPKQDVAEAAAIADVLGDVPVTCFAGGMGNVGASHGVIDLALSCEMMAAERVSPIRNCETLDPECPINAVTGKPLAKPIRRVMIVSAGIAAQCAAIVIEKP